MEIPTYTDCYIQMLNNSNCNELLNLRNTVLDTNSNKRLNPLRFKRSVFLKLPFIFPDYQKALQSVSPTSNGYLYPQGFSHDNINNTYINYSASKPYGMILVKYSSKGIYQGWVRVKSGLIENIVIVNQGNKLKLFSKTENNTLAWYDITSLKWSGDVINPNIIEKVQSVKLRIAQENDTWIIEKDNINSNLKITQFDILDKNFNKKKTIYIPKTIVGFQLPKYPMYNYIPKMQGIVLKNNQIYIGTGGSYIPSIDGKNSFPVSALGLIKIDLNGNLIDYSAINATKYLDYKKLNGYPNSIRTEVEGLSKLNDGTITQLVILSNRYDTEENRKNGIIIEKLNINNGVDYKNMTENYYPPNILNPYFLSSYSKKGIIYNPFNNSPMYTIKDIISFMDQISIPNLKISKLQSNMRFINNISLDNNSEILITNYGKYFMIEITSPNKNLKKYFYEPSKSKLLYLEN